MEAKTKAKIEEFVRRHRRDGGKAEAHEEHAKGKGAESADKGDDDAEKDLKSKPERRVNAPKIEGAAEEKEAKKGGRIKRKHGGMMKEVGRAEGGEAMHHAGRKRRASGGGCEANPFTSALKGTNPSGRKTERETKGYND